MTISSVLGENILFWSEATNMVLFMSALLAGLSLFCSTLCWCKWSILDLIHDSSPLPSPCTNSSISRHARMPSSLPSVDRWTRQFCCHCVFWPQRSWFSNRGGKADLNDGEANLPCHWLGVNQIELFWRCRSARVIPPPSLTCHWDLWSPVYRKKDGQP